MIIDLSAARGQTRAGMGSTTRAGGRRCRRQPHLRIELARPRADFYAAQVEAFAYLLVEQALARTAGKVDGGRAPSV